MLVKSVVQCLDDAYDVAIRLRWVPAQVSASSLDRGSKLRWPSPMGDFHLEKKNSAEGQLTRREPIR